MGSLTHFVFPMHNALVAFILYILTPMVNNIKNRKTHTTE